MVIDCTHVEKLSMIRVGLLGEKTRHFCGALEDQPDIQLYEIAIGSLTQIMTAIIDNRLEILILDHENTALHPDIVCAFIKQKSLNAKILVLSQYEPDFHMLKKTGFSVRGYISPEQKSLLKKAVIAVHADEAWLPRRLVAEMLDRFASDAASLPKPKFS